MTPAESRLWARLRAGRLHGLEWVRQEPVGPYIVDFYCSAARVVIELEGDAHGYSRSNDLARQAWLEEQGRAVLRFSNEAVYHRLAAVLEEVFEACKGSIPE